MSSFSKYLLISIIVASCSSQKNVGKSDTQLTNNLKGHITYLSDDKLEGRRTGSEGEKLAMAYISEQFKTIGLQAKGNDGYYQAFEVNDGKQIDPSTELFINGQKLESGRDFFPFPFSSEKSIEATPLLTVQEPDMPWFIDLKEILEENKSNPHFDLVDHIPSFFKLGKGQYKPKVIL